MIIRKHRKFVRRLTMVLLATAVGVLLKYITKVDITISNVTSEMAKPVVSKATASSIPAVITVGRHFVKSIE